MLKISFFDQSPYKSYYGNGDSTFIELPDGRNLLVDITTNDASERVIEHILKTGAKQIDYFIATHLHADHVGGFKKLTEKLAVKNVISSGYGENSIETDTSFLQTVKELSIPLKTARSGEKLKLGNVNVDFLFPPADIAEADPDLPYVEQEMNSNLYSLTFKLSYGDFSMLFTGDLYESTENELVKIYGDGLKSTVLKLAHHGNETSTGDMLINAVNPQLAVTMCRFCEWEVQKKLTNRGVLVYGPFFDGDIVMQTDGTVLHTGCNKGNTVINTKGLKEALR